MLKPPDLVGHVSLTLSPVNPNDARESLPVRPILPFQRVRDPKQREAHEVTVMLPPSTSVCRFHIDWAYGTLTRMTKQKIPEAFFMYSEEEMLRDYSVFVQNPETGSQRPGLSLQSHVSELEGEVQKLKEQLGKAKSINDTMWETVVRKVIVEGQGKSGETSELAMDVDESGTVSERQRSRGR